MNERVEQAEEQTRPFAHDATRAHYERTARARLWTWGAPALMFVLTVLSTLLAGALQRGVPPGMVFYRPSLLLEGLPYAATLLTILGAHEGGHYAASRRWGVDASLPWFLPAPSLIGTFGAVIRMRGIIPHRNALIDVAAAGPLAGMAVALPLLFTGLALSESVPAGVSGGIRLGTPLLFDVLARLAHGPISEGHDIVLHPVAFAGWCGLLVTALNLIPAGQLDGGHVAYALLGRRHAKASVAVGFALLAMGYWWPGWILWSVVVLALGRRHPPVLDAGAPLTIGRRILAFACMITLFCTFSLVPIRLF